MFLTNIEGRLQFCGLANSGSEKWIEQQRGPQWDLYRDSEWEVMVYRCGEMIVPDPELAPYKLHLCSTTVQ